MQPVKLFRVLENLDLEYVSDRRSLRSFVLRSLSTDSRSLKKDDLFIAIAGEYFDGHSFIESAVERGAGGVLFEMRSLDSVKTVVKKAPSVLFIGVKNTRRALGKIAESYLGFFSLTKIAITGSVGKTTTKGLVASVLSQRYDIVSSFQSYNNDIGVPKTVLEVNERTRFLVQEMGTNHPGEISNLSGIVHQNGAVITGIGPAHIGFFGSELEIAREKKAALEVLDRNGTAFLNADDRHFLFLKEGIVASVKSYGIHEGDVRPERIERIGLNGSVFMLWGRKIFAGVLGEHGILNAMAAALVGFSYGLTIDEVKAGIEAYKDESGRGNIRVVGGVTVIDESYNANPMSVSASLRFLEQIQTDGKKVFVFGDMLELGDQSEYYHRKFAEEFKATGIGYLYTYGPLASVTGSEVQKEGERMVRHFSDLDELIESLRREALSGDVILVKGSRKMGLERVVNSFF